MHPEWIRPGLDQSKARLIEEMGEVLVEFGKIDRFGWYNRWPNEPHVANNTQNLISELIDLKHAISMFEEELMKKVKKDLAEVENSS